MFRYQTLPWPHQARALEWLWQNIVANGGGGAMLAMDMGTGKTKVVVDFINNETAIHNVLITCPLSVVPTWPEEIATHGLIPMRVVALDKGSVARRTEKAEAAFAGNVPVSVVVINHEACWRQPFKDFVLCRQWDLLVVDECHRAKMPGGKFSKFLTLARDQCWYRLGLTGTPMPRDVLDIYAQARFLDPTVFGKSYTFFCAQYGNWKEIKTGRRDARGVPIAVRKLISVRNEDELQEKLDSMSFRVKADDVLDLPPAIVMRRTCELSPSERKFYDELKRDLIAEIDGGYVTASNALTKILRLQQAVQGIVTDEDGNVHTLGSSKADLLADVLESLDKDEPVVVFCRFHSDLDQVAAVAKDLGRSSLELSGRVNQLEEFKKHLSKLA
jgi:SNF2 family DNA or RNA helicase